MTQTLDILTTIKNARTDGEGAGREYIKQFGIEDARKYAHQLTVDNGPKPSPAMYGYVDGFMNAVVS